MPTPDHTDDSRLFSIDVVRRRIAEWVASIASIDELAAMWSEFEPSEPVQLFDRAMRELSDIYHDGERVPYQRGDK
jgi:uncharacterized sporulation protein YeaH/YhbH (DUF444 family)